jgi:Uma2 family endonuclease
MLKLSAEMTAEDYIAYAEAHADTHFDFIDGELVEVSPKVVHAWIQAFLARMFGNYLEGKALGVAVFTKALHVLDGEKLQPDVSINRPTHDDYFTAPPLVAVEIRSDTQSREAQRRKARAYIAHGTALVVLVMPTESVEVFRPGHDAEILALEDSLIGYDVLPGFELPVSGIFPDLLKD